MALRRWAFLAGLSAATAMGAATGGAAQGVPAETPPASYRGDQYVDSQGCIFVRVGVGGNVNWVPRVGRDRQQLCDFQPSLGGARQTVAAPNPASDETVVVIGGPVPSTTTSAAASTGLATARIPATPAARPVATTARSIGTTPRYVGSTARVVITPATADAAQAAGACPNLPADLQRYFTGDNVRCGPQEVHPGDVARGLVPSGSGGTGEEAQVIQRYVTVVPEGYDLAWDDGRLNPYRGLGTAQGQAQGAMVWTDTVPRQLVPAN